MYDPRTIASFFINKGIDMGDPLTQMKAQKLVYIAHGWYLAATGTALINCPVQAWKFGPVIPVIYQFLKIHGNDLIEDYYPNGEKLDKETIKFLNFIWDIYGKFTALHLSNLTHQDNTPWDVVAKKHRYLLPNDTVIDNDLIKEHFQQLLNRDKAHA